MATNDSVAITGLAVPQLHDIYGPYPVGTDTYDSDGGVSDPNSYWTNDANAIDGSLSTYAYHTTNASEVTGFLLVRMTTDAEPADIGQIQRVRVRVYHAKSGVDGSSDVDWKDASGSLLGAQPTGTGVTQTPGWSQWMKVNTPSGGWTWADVAGANSGAVVYGYNLGGNEYRLYAVQVHIVHSRGDALYVVGESGATANKLLVRKSTDGGGTWADVDTAGAPTLTGLQTLAVTQDAGTGNAFDGGGLLHMMTQSNYTAPVGMTAGSHDIKYHAFDLASDSWSITNEAVMTTTLNAAISTWYNGGIALRSDGDVVVVHYGDTYANMGSDWLDVVYSRREGGSWTTNVTLTGADNNNHNHPVFGISAVRGTSDGIHLRYQDSGSALGARDLATLRSNNTLSTAIDGGGSSPGTTEFGGFLTWNNGSSQYIALSNGTLWSRSVESGGDAATSAGEDTTPWATPQSAQYHTAYDSTNSTLYVVNNKDSTDPDQIQFATSTNDGNTWATPTVIEDQADSNTWWVIGAAIFTHSAGNGGDYVLGILIQQGTTATIHYDEYVITSGSTGQTIAVGVANE